MLPPIAPDLRQALLPVAAGVLFVDEHDRVLLVEPTYKPFWDLPGGIVEVGESPWGAAQREVKEELGLVVTPGRLLICDYLPPRAGAGREGLRLVFDGGQLDVDVDVRLDTMELRSWAWCTPAETIRRTEHAPILQRRILAARIARDSRGVAAYRESGRRP